MVIRGNRITDVRNLGVMAFMGLVSPEHVQQFDNQICDNLIVGKRPRHINADGKTLPVTGVFINGGDRWKVLHNTCSDGDYSGLSLYASQAPLNDCVVAGNRITDMGGRGIQILATQDFSARGFEIADNHIENCWDRGLFVAADEVRVLNNTITGASVAGISVGAPTFVTGSIWIQENTVREMRSGTPAIDIVDPSARVSLLRNVIADAEIGIRCRPGAVDWSENAFHQVRDLVGHILQ